MIKSVYKLDKRIKDVSDIQSPVRYDDSFIGEVCYFADSIWEFEDLESCNKGTLSEYIEDGYCQLGNFTANEFESDDYYGYFIPEKLLKPVEKKYRAYSLNEFLDKYEIGDKITFRLKLEEQPEDFIRHKVMFCGYQIVTGTADTPGEGFVNLGGTLVSLQHMFETYETPNSYLYPEVWEPFGVLDE